jgi:adenosylcobyric acid synthase
VEVLVTVNPDVVAGADLVVVPGSRSTVSDLAWLRRTGLADALAGRARRDAPTLGICGGYQMFAHTIDDRVESGSGLVAGLGLLPTAVVFEAEKRLGRPDGCWEGHSVSAYEIHHGVAVPTAAAEPFLDGWQQGQVWGTMWHGALENDDFRRAWLSGVAAVSGSPWRPDLAAAGFGARREHMIDSLADAIGEHVDVELLLDCTRVRL